MVIFLRGQSYYRDKKFDMALEDFKNPQGGNGVVASAELKEGQVSISNTASLVTIETCFNAIAGTGTGAATCTSGDDKSTIKNTIQID